MNRCPECGAKIRRGSVGASYPPTWWDHWREEHAPYKGMWLGGGYDPDAHIYCVSRQRAQLDHAHWILAEKLKEIKKHWQQGIGDLHNSWWLKMAELVGDEEGLLKAALAAKEKNGNSDT